MIREEEIKLLVQHLAKVWYAGANSNLEALFEQAVQWADEHPKSPWISVKERLPTNQKQKVIMRKRTGQHYCGWFDTSLNCFLTIDPSGTKWTINGVTHWMPRPELKKGE